MLEQQAETPVGRAGASLPRGGRGWRRRRARGRARAARGGRRDARASAYEDAARLYERALQALDLLDQPDACAARRAARRSGRSPAAHRGRRAARGARSRTCSPSRGGSIPRGVARCSPVRRSASPGVGPEVGRADDALVELLDEALGRARPRRRGAARPAARAPRGRAGLRADDTRRPRAERAGGRDGGARRRSRHARVRPRAPARRADGAWQRGRPATCWRRPSSSSRGAPAIASSPPRAVAGACSPALELGDLAGIEQDLDALGKLAEETRHPHYLWLAAMFRAMRALLAARFEEAEHLATEALAVGAATRQSERAGRVRLAVLRAALGPGTSRGDRAAAARLRGVSTTRSRCGRARARICMRLLGRLDEARARFEPACERS